MLPDVRPSITHKFQIHSGQGSHSCYMTVGFFDQGRKRPGEVFIRMGKQGSTLNGLLDTVGILISYGLQYGVPLADLCGKLKGITFEPGGGTSNPDLPKCSSIIDYVFAWLEQEYVDAPS
jgi:ribonucleoside-diphosphate reductase alpha chain